MRDLQRRRQSSKVFAGKEGFITPRDLFRWADRRAADYPALAEDGYMILAERLRDPTERQVVAQVLATHLKVHVDVRGMYDRGGDGAFQQLQAVLASSDCPADAKAALCTLAWSASLRRLFTLVSRCLENGENVLLVGVTLTLTLTLTTKVSLSPSPSPNPNPNPDPAPPSNPLIETCVSS